MKFRKNKYTKLVGYLSKLEATEFLGVCRILNVGLADEDGSPKEFEKLLEGVLIEFNELSSKRQKTLLSLLKEATKNATKN